MYFFNKHSRPRILTSLWQSKHTHRRKINSRVDIVANPEEKMTYLFVCTGEFGSWTVSNYDISLGHISIFMNLGNVRNEKPWKLIARRLNLHKGG